MEGQGCEPAQGLFSVAPQKALLALPGVGECSSGHEHPYQVEKRPGTVLVKVTVASFRSYCIFSLRGVSMAGKSALGRGD